MRENSERVRLKMKYLIEEAVVFAAGDNYNIIWNTTEKGLAWVEINGEKYYDADNGNIKSEEKIHKVVVPQNVLDKAGEYTIFFAATVARLPYYPQSLDEVSKKYKFYPVTKKEKINTYVIADTHSEEKYAVMAANRHELDFLILAGDIADKSMNLTEILTTFRAAAGITHGEKPVVFARGNHDTRGEMAPDLYKYIGTDRGNTYFTFKLGDIFGLVLDCGEDKPDDCNEYGKMAAFEPFRKAQITFLDEVIEKGEYKNYKHVIMVCHIRINYSWCEKFKDVYAQWLKRINVINPEVILSGHEHDYFIQEAGIELFDTGIKFNAPVVVGSRCTGNYHTDGADEDADFVGTFVSFDNSGYKTVFTDSKGETVEPRKQKS